MKTIREFKDLIIFILVMSVNLVCLYIGGLVTCCVSWGASALYVTYVIHDAYTERKRYYFVSFYANGNIGNANIVLKQSMKVRMAEDLISREHGGGKIIVLSFKRISRKQYEEMRDWNDNSEKD